MVIAGLMVAGCGGVGASNTQRGVLASKHTYQPTSCDDIARQWGRHLSTALVEARAGIRPYEVVQGHLDDFPPAYVDRAVTAETNSLIRALVEAGVTSADCSARRLWDTAEAEITDAARAVLLSDYIAARQADRDGVTPTWELVADDIIGRHLSWFWDDLDASGPRR